jgi:hypothetical protein
MLNKARQLKSGLARIDRRLVVLNPPPLREIPVLGFRRHHATEIAVSAGW